MKIKRFSPFYEPDDETSGPSAVGFMPPVGQEIDETDEGDPVEVETETETPTLTPAPSTTVDAAELAKQFGSVIGEHFKQQQQKPEEKPLTPEEAKKLLNVWEPDDAFVQKFGNLETQKAAIVEMRDALLKQFDTVAQMRLNEFRHTVETRLTPVQQMIEQQQAQAREDRFHSKFSQLAKPELRPLIQAVGNQLASAGKTFTDEESMFTALANGVEKVIQATTPGFKLTAASSTPRRGKIPVTTPGAGGSSGGNGSEPEGSKTPKAVSFLPRVR